MEANHVSGGFASLNKINVDVSKSTAAVSFLTCLQLALRLGLGQNFHHHA